MQTLSESPPARPLVAVSCVQSATLAGRQRNQAEADGSLCQPHRRSRVPNILWTLALLGPSGSSHCVLMQQSSHWPSSLPLSMHHVSGSVSGASSLHMLTKTVGVTQRLATPPKSRGL